MTAKFRKWMFIIIVIVLCLIIGTGLTIRYVNSLFKGPDYSGLPAYYPFKSTDEELRSLEIPVLFLVGENEVVYPANEAIRRLNTVAPGIITEVIQDASHDLTISQTRIVNSKAISFLLGIEKE
jgi:pimeloyl-ACP methyl ester carboxylesterase